MKHFYLSVIFVFAINLALLGQIPENFGTLTHSVDLGSQTQTPDRNLVGIQYAEGNLWVTGYDPDDYWQHKLYKFNNEGSELLETFSYGIEAAGWNDLAYDGEYLYVTDMDTIRQISTIDGTKTGITIPAPFYYNFGLAYNPINDHFYVSGEGGFNIYEIDRDGNIIGAIGGSPGNYYSGLAVDTVSPGSPFLWTYSNEEEGYNLILKSKQISLQTNQFTGVEFEGATISNIIQESAGGATISYDYIADSVIFIAINIRNGNVNDQMEYAMFYNITRTEIPGPQISVFPDNIQNTLVPGDSLDIDVLVYNNGTAPLSWSAYIETPDQDTIDNLGDLLFSFNATEQSQNNDRGLNGITFLNDKIWVNGRNFSNQQTTVYEFDKTGELLATHPYNTINSFGFRALGTDGEYLYGDDTYTITQIDPLNFSVVGYIIKPFSTISGLTYDPQTDHFWAGNGNGLIVEFDRDGNEINIFITNYDIQGLAWDQWSPGGPFIWAWVESENGEESQSEAIRLDPNTCTPVGNGFEGFNFSDDGFQDIPNGAVITNAWEEGKVSFLGLQNAEYSSGIEDNDFIAVYDLDVTPPPDWIELINPSYGSTLEGDSSQFTVRLHAIMDDTLMNAIIRIANNDILNPEIVIPINFEMTSAFTTGIEEKVEKRSIILGQNFPNPFFHETIIPFTLLETTDVAVKVYNSMGMLVWKLVRNQLETGRHEILFDSNGLSSGIYYFSLETPTNIITKQMILKK